MWFIKVDDEITLEDVCNAISMEPKALFNPLQQNVLNIVLHNSKDVAQTDNMVYTNIILSFENVELQMKNGKPYGEINKDITGLSLYIDENNYQLADKVMNEFDNNDIRVMMAKL